MKAFFKKIVYASIIPLVFYITVFIYYERYDVYQDFGRYANYSWKYEFQSLGDLSTKKLLNSKSKYNTFIFGSSRTTSLYACYLQEKFRNAKAFHYANWNESIGGILAKIKLLDSLDYQLTNIVIYIDTDFTFDDDGRCKSYDHYLLTHTPKTNYLFNHFSSFISHKENYNILLGGTPEKDKFPNRHSDPVTNDPYHTCSDSTIASYGSDQLTRQDSLKIASLKRSKFFYERDNQQKFLDRQISEGEIEITRKIMRILNQHHTKLYVIVTPIYDQMKFHQDDLAILENAFGGSLHDFSGINTITNNEFNYRPDRKHFREIVSKQIIDSILKE